MVNNTTLSEELHVVEIGNKHFKLSLGLAYGRVVCSCLEPIPPHLKPKHPQAWYYQLDPMLVPSGVY